MEIATQQRGAVLVIRPVGPLTGPEVPTVKARVLDLIRQHLGRIVMDASALSYVDSQGLECLVDVAEALEQGGKGLKVCAANDTLQRVIELTGLASRFEHFPDTTAAVRSFL